MIKLDTDELNRYQFSLNWIRMPRVSKDGIMVDPDTVRAIAEMPPPKNVREVRIFLGKAGFYRKFIQQYAHKAHPLTELLKADILFVWDSRRQDAFEQLRQDLIQAPILISPDWTKQFYVQTDGSNITAGAVLSQLDMDQFL